MQTEEKVSSSRLRSESLEGKTFGWLKVIAPAERPPEGSRKARGSWWLCRCRCGNEKIVARGYLVQKNVTSCGCKKRRPKASDDLIPAIRFTGKPEKKSANIKLASSCSGLATECLCANCGKTFDRLSDKWVYKTTIGTRLHWFCSWKCLRAATNQDRQPAAAHA